MWKFSNFDFFKFLKNLGLSNKSVGKHLCEISLKSIVALSTHWSLNPETSWFFDFKLEPTMLVTRQNMQWYWYCPKMPRTTIRQCWSVIALIALNRTGMRAPAIFRRIGIPRRAENMASGPMKSQISLAVADPAMTANWTQLTLRRPNCTEIYWSHPRAS